MKKNTLIKKTGYPLPFGVCVKEEGVNFAVFSRDAVSVSLVLCWGSEGREENIEVKLDPVLNKTGDVWHVQLDCCDYNFRYGYRIEGPGEHFNPARILIDPFCQKLVPRAWGERGSYGEEPVGMLLQHDFDWQNDRPLNIPLEDTVIYELHVRGFTKDGSSKVTAPGTYRGLVEKIDYFKELGVTAVELMPVTEFDENDNVFVSPEDGEKLNNYWGYNPLSFFAIKSGYAEEPENHINEFKEMVRSLHEAGIEVILDMVFNHTGEGGYDGNTCTFRGIDNRIYYLLDSEDGSYLNYSGCGNTMNCNHPVVRDLIKYSLRFWVTEMHVDGFRFDLASILGRDTNGKVLANPPIIEIIAEDPVLRNTKIIAEAWDAAGLYQVGSFSSDKRWAEWNGRFRDDVRSFAAGNSNSITKLATRIAGSSDLYQTSCRSPLSSINFLTSHDGFTLFDLVSYEGKHNLANGENNKDGDNHNTSWNSGMEGPSDDLLLFRKRRMKLMTVLLLLSQGVPMITAGDEVARTQLGNNNAWCQDNKMSWFDWNSIEKHNDLLRFFKGCIRLRGQNSLFRRTEFFTQIEKQELPGQQSDIIWQSLNPGEEDWSEDCHHLAFILRKGIDEKERSEFFVMVNGDRSEKVRFQVPEVSRESTAWYKVIDTSQPSPEDVVGKTDAMKNNTSFSSVEAEPQTVIVLQAFIKE